MGGEVKGIFKILSIGACSAQGWEESSPAGRPLLASYWPTLPFGCSAPPGKNRCSTMLWARRKISAVKTTMNTNFRSPPKRARLSSGSNVFQGVLIPTAFPGFGCSFSSRCHSILRRRDRRAESSIPSASARGFIYRSRPARRMPSRWNTCSSISHSLNIWMYALAKKGRGLRNLRYIGSNPQKAK
jgi:hypothetical protein